MKTTTPRPALLAFVAAMMVSVLPLRAQDTATCDTVRTFPWTETFQNGLQCWYKPEGSRFSSEIPYNDPAYESHRYLYSSCLSDGWVMSQPIAIPDSAAARLVWRVSSSNSSIMLRYRMMVTTDTAWTDTSVYQTVILDHSTHRNWSNWDTMSASLYQYAGQTIRIAINNCPVSSASGIYIDDVGIRMDSVPIVRLLAPFSAVDLNEEVTYTGVLDEGNPFGVTFTWHSTLLGRTDTVLMDSSSQWSVVYTTPGTDTVTLVATNAYGIHTATAVVSVLPLRAQDTATCDTVRTFPWTETFQNGLQCWYKPEGSRFSSEIPYNDPAYESHRYLYSSCLSDGWVMSQPIAIPDSAAARLVWRVSSSNSSIMLRYRMMVTTDTAWTDTSVYQTVILDHSTHRNWSNWDTMSASLYQYAGQTIRIAINNRPVSSASGIYIDDVGIRIDSVPIVRLLAPFSVVDLNEEVTYTGVLDEGLHFGVTFTWHSSLLGRTDTVSMDSSSQWSVVYTTPGTDTVTLVATNRYGSSTVTAVVEVVQCFDIEALPYEEDFSALNAVDLYTDGEMPTCWRTSWSNSATSYLAPHVINDYPSSGIRSYVQTNNALVMVAGLNSGFEPVVIVESPSFAMPLHGLTLSFFYKHESATRGTLSVGYMQGGAFVGVADLEQQASGAIATVSLGGFPTDIRRFALQWKAYHSWWGVIVDNIELYSASGIPAPENLVVDSLAARSAHISWDPVAGAVAYMVTLGQGHDTVVVQPSITLHGLTPETRYRIAVAAIGSTGFGAFAPLSFTTPAIRLFTLTVEANDPAMGFVSGAGTYDEGTLVSIGATPNQGYHFEGWSITPGYQNIVTDNPFTVIVTEDMSIVAYFAADTVGIGSLSDGTAVRVEGTHIVVHGTQEQTLALYDALGRCLAYEVQVPGHTAIFRAPAAGVYILRIGDRPARRVVVVP